MPPLVVYVPRSSPRSREGWVHLCFAQDEAGQFVDFRVLEAEPAGVLDAPAVDVLADRRAQQPELLDGRPVARLGRQALVVFGTCDPPASEPARQVWLTSAGALGPTHRVEPDYPRAAWEQEVEGSVTLDFGIDANGQVLDIQVLNSQPLGVFDEVAMAAVWQWRYCPLGMAPGTDRRAVTRLTFERDDR